MNPAPSGGECNFDAADVSMTPLVEELSSSLDPWDVCRRLAHLPHVLFLDSATADPATIVVTIDASGLGMPSFRISQ